MNRYSTAIIRILFIVILILSFNQQTFSQNSKNFIGLGFSNWDPNFSIDFNEIFLEIPTHFFSSRQAKYIGYYLEFERFRNFEQNSGTGFFTKLIWGETSFLVNWEITDISAMEPMDGHLYLFYFDFGVLYFKKLAFIFIKPYISLNAGWYTLEVNLQNNLFDGSKFFMGLSPGLGIKSPIFKNLFLILDARMTFSTSNSSSIQVSDINFPYEFKTPTMEYQFGLQYGF